MSPAAAEQQAAALAENDREIAAWQTIAQDVKTLDLCRGATCPKIGTAAVFLIAQSPDQAGVQAVILTIRNTGWPISSLPIFRRKTVWLCEVTYEARSNELASRYA